jgi:tetratricopeptide (TPR) repeat protein
MDEAEQHLRESLRILRTGDTEEYRAERHITAGDLSRVLEDRGGDYREAETLARECLARAMSLPPHHWEASYWLLRVAVLCRRRGDHAEAEQLEQRVLDSPVTQGYPNLIVVRFLDELGEALSGFDRHAVAERPFGVRLGILESLCPNHWLRFDAMSVLGGCLAAQGRFAEAEPLLLAAHQSLAERPTIPAENVRSAVGRIATLYEAWHGTEPGKGYDASAAEWRARRETLEPAVGPGSPR